MVANTDYLLVRSRTAVASLVHPDIYQANQGPQVYAAAQVVRWIAHAPDGSWGGDREGGFQQRKEAVTIEKRLGLMNMNGLCGVNRYRVVFAPSPRGPPATAGSKTNMKITFEQRRLGTPSLATGQTT